MRKQLKATKEKRSEEALTKFHIEIMSIRETTDSVLEAIVAYCDKHSADVEDVFDLIGPSLKSIIEKESLERGLIKAEPEPEGLELC